MKEDFKKHNWDTILKRKSNRELHDIYIGNTHLTGPISGLARKEPENKSFNFENK
jgi:hypothetical protein